MRIRHTDEWIGLLVVAAVVVLIVHFGLNADIWLSAAFGSCAASRDVV